MAFFIGRGESRGAKASPSDLLRNLMSKMRPSRMICFESLPLSALGGLLSFVYGSLAALILLVGEQRGVSNSAVFFFVYAAVALLSRPVAGKLCDVYGLKKLAFPMATFACAGVLVLAFACNTALFALAAALFALGQGSICPCLQAEGVRAAPSEKSSLAANTFYIGIDAGMALGPILSGAVYQAFGAFAMLMSNLMICVAFAVLYAVGFCRKGRAN